MTTFRELLGARQRFLLTGHENPDGDCLGAEVALFHLLRALGHEVAIVNPDPVGPAYDFLLRHTPIGHLTAEVALPQFDVVVLLDCSLLSRTGPLAPRLLERGATLAVIDHHVGSDRGDGTVHYVDPKAPATGALVRRLYRELGVPLSPPAAEGVFLSLVADTGWFRYSNTDHEVLSMAAELVAAGVDPSRIYDNLYRRLHPDSVALLGDMLARHQLKLGQRLAIACLDRGLMERAARIDFDTDAVLDPLRSLGPVEVVALLKERFDGAVKVSLRAKGDVDVQQVAAAFGGGGHRKAAGATVREPLEVVAQRVEQQVAVALQSSARVRD